MDGDTLEFRGQKHGTIRLTGVRAVQRVQDSSQTPAYAVVTYGSPEATERFLDYRRGKLRANSQAETLVSELRTLFGLKAAGSEMSDTATQAAALEAMKKLRIRMAVAGAVLVVGTLVTVITMTGAQRQGGTYFVAYGAILFGLAAFYRGGGQTPQGGEDLPGGGRSPGPGPRQGAHPRRRRPLKAARDVDGLVRALWHDDIPVRVEVMDALAELGTRVPSTRCSPRSTALGGTCGGRPRRLWASSAIRARSTPSQGHAEGRERDGPGRRRAVHRGPAGSVVPTAPAGGGVTHAGRPAAAVTEPPGGVLPSLTHVLDGIRWVGPEGSSESGRLEVGAGWAEFRGGQTILRLTDVRFEYNTALHHVYLPARDTWEARAPLPTTRSGHGLRSIAAATAAMGGEAGGPHRRRAAPGQVYGQMESYDRPRPPGSATPRCRRRVTPSAPPRSATGFMSPAAARARRPVQSAVHEAFTLA